jgi:hypothetical protein
MPQLKTTEKTIWITARVLAIGIGFLATGGKKRSLGMTFETDYLKEKS